MVDNIFSISSFFIFFFLLAVTLSTTQGYYKNYIGIVASLKSFIAYSVLESHENDINL